VAFDVEVAVPGHESYRIEEVGKPPELLVEILSDKTAKKDQDAATGKLGAYAEMGVQEYLTFDPRPRRRLALVGHRLVRVGTYAPIVPEAEGGLWLETLGLRVVAEPENRQLGREPRLRFYTADGSPLPHADEEAALREQAQRAQKQAEQMQLQAEREREQDRLEMERKVAALEARLAQLHGDTIPPPDDLDSR